MSPSTKLPLAKASRRLHLRQLVLVPKPVPAAYYLANKERIIAQSRAWYAAHRELVLARLAASYAKHPQKYIRRMELTQARRRVKSTSPAQASA
jgi:hypothetical protein